MVVFLLEEHSNIDLKRAQFTRKHHLNQPFLKKQQLKEVTITFLIAIKKTVI